MSNPMTPERLAEIEARANAATEGPWEETWLPIPGYAGYEVSDFGNVRSYYLKGNHKRKRSPHPRTLAKRARRGGAYPSVSLPNPATGKYHSKAIHRLVMLAFVGPCPEGMEVAHLNGDPTDNHLSNLEYVTHLVNESHKQRHGTSGVGERNSNARLQGWQVAEVKFLADKSVPQGKIAELFDISHKQVSDILRGRSWAKKPARTDVPALLVEVRRLQDAAEQFAVTLGFGGPEPAATLAELVDPIEEAFGAARDHFECPVICEPCGEPLASQTCEKCHGSGCLPNAALAYLECDECAGAGKVHPGCAEMSYADLAAEVRRLQAAVDRVRALHYQYIDSSGTLRPECECGDR